MKTCRLLLIFSIVFALAACQGVSVSEWLASSGDWLYRDDFGNPNSGWARLAGSSGVADFNEGMFRILVTLPYYDLWSTPGLSFHDVRIEVDAARINGPDENRYGLICRYQDARHFYFFIVSSDGYYAIGKMDDGVHTLLGQEMMAHTDYINPGIAPNHIRAECIGNILALYVNDQPLAVTWDVDFKAGDIGLIVGTFSQAGADVLFDNLVVIKP